MVRLLCAMMPLVSAITVPAPQKVVLKFGGSSLRDAERITEVCSLVVSLMEDDGIRPCLVCSAMGKTTNGLLAAADNAIANGVADLSVVRKLHVQTIEDLNVKGTAYADEVCSLIDQCERTLEGVALLGELSPRTRDLVVSYGERLSGRMVAAALNTRLRTSKKLTGFSAIQIEAWDIGVVTSSEFGEATPLEESWTQIPLKLNPILGAGNIVPIVTGFIGKDVNGRVTTLGRGGSDLTASLLGASAGLDEVQVWKDVDGILTADPRLCPNALPVPRVSFEEAAELAYFGAQVLHPLAMQPCIRAGVPMRVKNSYNRYAEGTLITQTRGSSEPALVSCITSKDNVQLVDIVSTRMLGQYGFLARVFEAFDKWKLSVDVIASSEVSVSLTLNRNQIIARKEADVAITENSPELKGLIADLQKVAQVSVTGGHAIVTLIANVEKSPTVVAIVCAVMAKLGISIQMISQGASRVNISIVVPSDRSKEAVAELHKCFFEKDSCCLGSEMVDGLSSTGN
jgi:aspartate kinase